MPALKLEYEFESGAFAILFMERVKTYISQDVAMMRQGSKVTILMDEEHLKKVEHLAKVTFCLKK